MKWIVHAAAVLIALEGAGMIPAAIFLIVMAFTSVDNPISLGAAILLSSPGLVLAYMWVNAARLVASERPRAESTSMRKVLDVNSVAAVLLVNVAFLAVLFGSFARIGPSWGLLLFGVPAGVVALGCSVHLFRRLIGLEPLGA